MRDLKDLIAHRSRAAAQKIDSVMASIVWTQGSTYRRVGTHAFISADGKMTGLLSGGCLESDIVEHAKTVMITRVPKLITYDNSAPTDMIFGLGLGCNGIVKILLEPATALSTNTFLNTLNEAFSNRSEPFKSVLTVFDKDENAPLNISDRFYLQNGAYFTTHSNSGVGDVPSCVLEALLKTSQNKKNNNVTLVFDNGAKAEALCEIVGPPFCLAIFGAGPDAIPLARLSTELGWDVCILDYREELLERCAAGINCVRQLLTWDTLETLLENVRPSLVAIMTHHFESDVKILRTVLQNPPFYVGLLGPTSRGDLVLNELGLERSAAILPFFHNPMGLDLGGDSPEHVALATVAEMQLVLSDTTGKKLRDKGGFIHARS